MSDHFLALDAATGVATVAVGSPGRELLERVVGREPLRHASRCVPVVRDLLDETGIRPADLAGIVVADGPGSFTGLRVAAGLAKGLIHGTRCRLYAVPSLLGCAARIAAAQPGAGRVAALYDALRGDLFVGLWAPDDRRVVRSAVPATDLERLGTVAVAGGPGAVAHPNAVRAWTGGAPVGPPVGQASASALLDLALAAPETYEIREPLAWEPEYGRPAEAQARWEAQHGRPLPDSSRPSR